ncbi:hypothetical protein L1987_79027 [Smallanthus sonchifolius]|uniref:Uncharacterized protein n=1 Tax=Smallanthus sonchifolius TaxID=185202 RepID=A0ACB8ZEB2_9ASTR|nr:hypothetical protein L1987_79027 [Smallanthus sonchifolius]
MPPRIKDQEVGLFDLYSNYVAETNQWGIVAECFGCQKDVENKIKGIWERYLEMPNAYYEIVTDDLEKATKKGCKDVKAKKVKSNGKGCDQARVQEAVDIGLNQADKFMEIKGVADWEGQSEENDETESEEAAVAEHVKVLYEDPNNLIITLDEGSDDEPSMEDEDSPSEEESKNNGDYVFIDSE